MCIVRWDVGGQVPCWHALVCTVQWDVGGQVPCWHATWLLRIATVLTEPLKKLGDEDTTQSRLASSENV